MKHSLLSAALGHIAGSLTLMFYFGPAELGRHIASWPSYFFLAFIYGAPLMLFVWLLILWPLYSRIPINSVLWYPALCIPLGAIAGALLYFAIFRLVFQLPSSVLLSPGHLLAGAFAGAVTCRFGCHFKHHSLSAKVA